MSESRGTETWMDTFQVGIKYVGEHSSEANDFNQVWNKLQSIIIIFHNMTLIHSIHSLGQRLRTLADAGGRPASDGALARIAISGGELAPKELVTKLVRAAVNDARRTGNGLVLDGYPRDLYQMEGFQTEVLILIYFLQK